MMAPAARVPRAMPASGGSGGASPAVPAARNPLRRGDRLARGCGTGAGAGAVSPEKVSPEKVSSKERGTRPRVIEGEAPGPPAVEASAARDRRRWNGRRHRCRAGEREAASSRVASSASPRRPRLVVEGFLEGEGLFVHARRGRRRRPERHEAQADERVQERAGTLRVLPAPSTAATCSPAGSVEQLTLGGPR